MTKKSTYLLGIVLTIGIGAILNGWFCCNTQMEDTTTISAIQSTDTIFVPIKKVSVPLILRDPGGNFDYSTTDNIHFKHSSKDIIEPLIIQVETGILKLTNYMNRHPQKNLDITGHYLQGEVYTGSFPNLGMARATTIKNYLISQGIPSKQMNIFGVRKDHIPIQDSILLGPVGFSIYDVDSTLKINKITLSEELRAVGASLKEHPLVLHFETGESEIRLSPAQREKIVHISNYLDKIDDAKCLIIGHTDNTGPSSNHVPLGQERANFAREYLIHNGILPQKIIAISKGAQQPIAPNANAAGRAKNRRTVITIN